jgi:hypothetical protein
MTSGGCLCGGVRFEVEEFTAGIFKCHCSKCRKAFGGASSAAALCAKESFSWAQGQDAIREYRASEGFLRRFCADCGSILPQYLKNYQQYWVPAGLLDTDPGLTLKKHIHVASKAPWEVLDDETRQLPEGF